MAISFEPIALAEYDEYVRAGRRALLRGFSEEPGAPKDYESIRQATLYGCFNDGRIVGYMEWYFISDVYERADQMPYNTVFDFANLGDYNRIAWLRSLYLNPEERRNRWLYPRFLMWGLSQAHQRPIEFVGTSTGRHVDYLCALYTKTGGQPMGEIRLQGRSWTAACYLFSMASLLHHPLLSRFRPPDSLPT